MIGFNIQKQEEYLKDGIKQCCITKLNTIRHNIMDKQLIHVIVRNQDNEKFISVRDLIINKQSQIMAYQKIVSKYYSDGELKAQIAEAFLEILQSDLDTFNRIYNEG